MVVIQLHIFSVKHLSFKNQQPFIVGLGLDFCVCWLFNHVKQNCCSVHIVYVKNLYYPSFLTLSALIKSLSSPKPIEMFKPICLTRKKVF